MKVHSINKASFKIFSVILVLCVLNVSGELGAQELKFAHLKEFSLESGDVFAPCKIGYRTYGKLNAEKSNAILATVWFTGNSGQIAVGKDQVLDSTKYFILVVGPFGNGVSSSPSNYKPSANKKFPEFNIRDMVKAQHWLVTEKFGISQLFAVTGASMGGMQAFEWLVTYPDMVKKVIPVVATPQLTSHDLLSMDIMQLGLEAGINCNTCDTADFFSAYTSSILRTPQFRIRETAPDQYPEFLKGVLAEGRKDFIPENIISQIKAIRKHDITKPYEGSWEETVSRAKANVLVIFNTADHSLRYEPALKFAEMSGAKILQFNSDCGHLITVCEHEKIDKAVTQFLGSL